MTIGQVISKKSQWTQGTDARDKNGNPINVRSFDFFNPPRLKDIASFSLQGAVSFLYSSDRFMDKRLDVMRKLRKAIRQYTGKDLYVAAFNDSHTTTFEDVQAVLKIFKKI